MLTAARASGSVSDAGAPEAPTLNVEPAVVTRMGPTGLEVEISFTVLASDSVSETEWPGALMLLFTHPELKRYPVGLEIESVLPAEIDSDTDDGTPEMPAPSRVQPRALHSEGMKDI